MGRCQSHKAASQASATAQRAPSRVRVWQYGGHNTLVLGAFVVTIHPIETTYKGYKFRSPASRRDGLFSSKPQESAGTTRYRDIGLMGGPTCPTSFLPDLDCFLEVKPSSESDRAFHHSFPNEIGKPVVVSEGRASLSDRVSCSDNIQLSVLR